MPPRVYSNFASLTAGNPNSTPRNTPISERSQQTPEDPRLPVAAFCRARRAWLIQGLRPAFLNVFVFNATAVLRIVRWQIRALAGFLLLPKGTLNRKPNSDIEILRRNK
jgi:hypothetical protein